MLLRSLGTVALAIPLLIAPLDAQSGRPGGFGITPYAGYMKFGNLVDGPVGTTVRGAAGAVYGAEATLGLLPGLALVGNLAYASSDLEVGAPLVGGLSVGRSSALLYDAALRLSLPLGVAHGVRPFVQAGAGAMRHELAVGPVETRSTSPAYNLGAGVEVPLAPRLGLQLMAKDYIGKLGAQATTEMNVEPRTTHNWAVGVGVRLGL